MHYSVSQLAKEFGLSRSTLLYYDSIGLLKPQKRATGSYRVYTEAHHRKLQQICQLRNTGVGLREISNILDKNQSHLAELLQERLSTINDEINHLRNQQKIIIELLGNHKLLKTTKVLTKAKWITMLEAAGLDEQGMLRWHQEFESTAPQAHQDFLASLGLSSSEIQKIRQFSSQRTTP